MFPRDKKCFSASDGWNSELIMFFLHPVNVELAFFLCNLLVNTQKQHGPWLGLADFHSKTIFVQYFSEYENVYEAENQRSC